MTICLNLNPDIWGPSYWHFLHTIAMNYPQYPTETIKKKYYDFLQNLYLFLPSNDIGTYMSSLLKEYPLMPYLDNTESLVRWMHFIHNKVNEKLEKPQQELHDFYHQFYERYKSPQLKIREHQLWKKYIIYVLLFLFIFFFTIYMYYLG